MKILTYTNRQVWRIEHEGKIYHLEIATDDKGNIKSFVADDTGEVTTTQVAQDLLKEISENEWRPV